jgi:hypothetical protein
MKVELLVLHRVSEKSGTNGNFNNLFYIFIYRLNLNVKMLKMALTLDERAEIVLGDS